MFSTLLVLNRRELISIKLLYIFKTFLWSLKIVICFIVSDSSNEFSCYNDFLFIVHTHSVIIIIYIVCAIQEEFHIQSKSVIMSMAYNKIFIIMRVLKCTVTMHMLYIVMLFGNSESLSINLFVITRDLKVAV
jgi:hypothetical protein